MSTALTAGRWTAVVGIVTALGTAIPALVTSLSNSADLAATVDANKSALVLAQRAVAENKEMLRDMNILLRELDRSFAVLSERLRGFEVADRILLARTVSPASPQP